MFNDVINKVMVTGYGVAEDKVFDAHVERGTFLRREQTPGDIGEAVVYLCHAENVTGVTLTVAGGAELH